MVKRKRRSELREWIKTILVAGTVVILFRGMVAQAYQIPSGSMENTLLVGDYIYINKMLYGSEIDLGFQGHRFFYHRFPAFREPRPGDIIVFRYPGDQRKDFIKRCVAVAGQTIEIRSKTLYVDGKKRDEPFTVHGDPRVFSAEQSPRDNFGPFVVPQGAVFMMGDNRDNSLDSRFWGPLPMSLIRGKAIFRYFSWDGERHFPRFGQILRPIR